ncbi:MAG TPA: LacI family DNA-binding transcriptional regulator [Arthrobacter sp.]|nr:LacI family DNA-binding transcriptional regulator [Arthrobacter sp.]
MSATEGERFKGEAAPAVSIDDVAMAAGVSTATVSRAVRGIPGVSAATRDRVLKIVERLGYVPSSSASGLASGRTMTMGVVVPMIERWYFATALGGADRALRAAGYDLMVFNLGGAEGNRERVFHRSMLRKRIDALLVMCMSLTEEELVSLRALDSPSIVVGSNLEGVRHVSIDDPVAVRDAVEHLIGLGHRDIAHLQGTGEYGFDFSVPLLRNEAFETTMQAHGLPVRPEWTALGNFRTVDSKAAAGRLLDDSGNRPTAIFASSDEMAFGVMMAAAERGIRIPEELSVVGIDDHELSEPAGLTTIRQRPDEQGAFAAGMLLAELAGAPRAQPPVQPHELIVRKTTAPPPVTT